MRRIPRGHTLVEMLIAMSILVVIAGVAVRGLAGADAGQLEGAAGEVAGALRFARTEAMRTGAWHGVDFGAPAGAERRIRVFRIAAASPTTPLFDVRHPVDKTLYDVALSARAGTGSVTLSQAAFHYRAGSSTVTREWVAFDASGTPDYYPDAATYAAHGDAVWINAVLLTQADRSRQVLLDPATGRVTAP